MSAISPVVISSGNGNRYRNGGDVTCVEKAFAEMTGGADVLDAVIAGGANVELVRPGSAAGVLDILRGTGGTPEALEWTRRA